MPRRTHEPATTSLGIKVTAREHEQIKAAAAKIGLTPSAYARLAVTKSKVRPLVIDPICKAQWIELARLASNLNQTAHGLNCDIYQDTDVIQGEIIKTRDLLAAIRAHLAGHIEAQK